MPDFLTGEQHGADLAACRAHLAACEACRVEAEELAALWAGLGLLPDERPGPALRETFYRMLEAQGQPRRKSLAWRPLAVAAALLGCLSLGFMAGRGWAPETPRVGVTPEVALLRAERSDLRLAGVMLAARSEDEGPGVPETLLAMLETDPSESVRLAAVDALFLYGRQPWVRERLAATLPRQTSVMVQLALVDLLGGLREQRAREALEALLASPGASPEVARRARQRLQERAL